MQKELNLLMHTKNLSISSIAVNVVVVVMLPNPISSYFLQPLCDSIIGLSRTVFISDTSDNNNLSPILPVYVPSPINLGLEETR